jgi:hexokinase
MEWGNFWSSHLPRTSYDIDLDADSPNPNDQVSKVQLLTLFIALLLRD